MYTKKNQIILIIIGVLILIGLATTFNYWFKYLQPPLQVAKEKEEASGPCAEFPKIKGEISCQEAINKVLEKYPGEVKYVKKTKASLPMGTLPNVEMVEKEVWVIGINLNSPMEMDERELKGMEIFVTRDSGDLEINYVTSGEI